MVGFVDPYRMIFGWSSVPSTVEIDQTGGQRALTPAETAAYLALASRLDREHPSDLRPPVVEVDHRHADAEATAILLLLRD